MPTYIHAVVIICVCQIFIKETVCLFILYILYSCILNVYNMINMICARYASRFTSFRGKKS